MKFNLLSFLLLLFFPIIASYAQSANVVEGCVPLEVKFQAPASSSGYFWDFKDGVTSNRQDPTNIFNRAGHYTVTFQESPSGPVLGTILIKVHEVPVLQINRLTGCAPFEANFINTTLTDTTSIKVKNYTWIFGDGNTSTGIKNPTHVYKLPGLYSVSLSIQTDFPSCNKTAVFERAVDVFSPPTASFITNPANTTTCTDSLDVTFTSASKGVKPMVFIWDFNNGNSSDKESPAPQRYYTGEHSPTLSVSYSDFPSCSSSFSKKLVVFPTIKPEIKVSKDTVCLHAPTLLATPNTGKYKWSVSPAISTPMPDNDSMLVTFMKAGIYTVSLTVSSEDGICSASTQKRLVADSISAGIVSSPAFSCQPTVTINYSGISNRNDVNYLWTFLTRTDTSQNPSYTYQSTTARIKYALHEVELLPVSLTVTDVYTGCTASFSKRDTLWRPNALFSVDQNKGCFPLTVSFLDKSTSAGQRPIAKWQWIFGDGKDTTLTSDSPVKHLYTATGQFEAVLIVETADGCRDTSYSTLIKVGQDVTGLIDFSANKITVCPGEEVKFTALLPSSPSLESYYFTSGGNQIIKCENDPQIIWQYSDQIGLQDVSMYVSHNGCISSRKKEKLVHVKGSLSRIDYDYLCQDPFSYHFKSKSSGASRLEWSFGDGQTSTEENISHAYSQTGNYKVVLTAINDTSGCLPDVDSLTVYVRNVKAHITSDTTLCLDVPRRFSASNSTDVASGCFTGYEWQFPTLDKRPHISAKDTASFRFPKKGLHQILLIVKDINGCKDTTSATVKVYDIDIAGIADKLMICPPNAVQFSDSSRGDTLLTKWEWNFDDNSPISNKRNPLHHFAAATPDGIFSVTLKVSDSLGCSENMTIPVTQYRPTSKIQVSDSTLCEGDSVVISATDFTKAGSRLTFKWNLGNGMTGDQQLNRLRYDSAGNYKLKLYYQEISSQCSDSAIFFLPVQGFPEAKMATSADTVALLCAPRNIVFRDISESKHPLSHHWNFGNGVIASREEHSLTFPKGTFLVKHSVRTSFGCSDSTERVFKVLSPEGNFDISPATAICKGDSIRFVLKDTVDVANFTWAFGDGTVAHNVSPVTHHYTFHPPSGETEARLILQGQEGCQFSPDQKKIKIHQVIASFIRETGLDTSICMSENPYRFANNSQSFDLYLWDFGDGSSSTEQNPVHYYQHPGTYQVKLSISDQETKCKDTLVRTAIVFANPHLIAFGDTACPQNGLRPKVLNPSPASTYAWYNATGTFSAEGPEPVLLSKGVTFYKVIETNESGCTDTAEVRTQVIDPIGLHNFDTTIVSGDSAVLPVAKSSFYTFHWTTDESLSCTNCDYPVARPLKSTQYILKVTDIRGCTVPEYYFNITIRPETFVKLPSSFTPNGDGINDIVYLNGWGIKEVEEFVIFNRWGRIVFQTNRMDEGWDGKVGGIVQNTDVYVYKVKARNWKDEDLFAEGFINLIR